jgi:hypothetical protein
VKYVPSIIKLSDIPVSDKAREKFADLAPDTEIIRKGFVTKEMNLDPVNRTMKQYISTLDIDWEGEVLLPDGMNDAHFTGVVMYAHDYMSLPIGTSQWMKKDPKGVISQARIGTHPEAEAFYTTVFIDGIPISASVGFVRDEKAYKPGMGFYADGAEAEESAKVYGEALKKWKEQYRVAYGKTPKGEPSIITSKWSLLEYSMVPVPMNPGVNQDVKTKALIKKAVDAGFIVEDEPEIKTMTSEEYVAEEIKAGRMFDFKAALDEIIERLDEMDDRLTVIEEPEEKIEDDPKEDKSITIRESEKVSLSKEEIGALVQDAATKAVTQFRNIKRGRMD